MLATSYTLLKEERRIQIISSFTLPGPQEGHTPTEVQKGVEHGSIAPRRKWTKLKNEYGRRIWDKSTALVSIIINRFIAKLSKSPSPS